MSTEAAVRPPAEPLYRSGPFLAFPCGRSRELCYFELDGSVQILSTADARLLGHCEEFRQLSEHVRVIAGERQVLDDDLAILARLTELAQTGRLISDVEILRRCTRASEAAPDGDEIRWLATVTSERTQLLQRAISTFAENARTWGRPTQFLISDDAASIGSSDARRLTLRALGRRLNVALFYAGRADKLRFVDRLSEGGRIPRDVLEFALLAPGFEGASFGANRNAILLHTLGAKLLSVDDDTVCAPSTAAQATLDTSLVLAGDADETEMWFHTDRESVLRHARPVCVDVIGAHEQLLGTSPSALARVAQSSGADISMHKACVHLLNSLYKGAGRIVATLNGIAGDSGMYSGELIVMKEGATRSRLFGSDEMFEVATRSRELISHVTAPTLSHAGPFMSTFIGLDNRELLPPFVPVCRNEDGVFGVMLGACVSDAFQAHMPWALLHAPPDARTYPRDAWSVTRFSDVVLSLLRSCRPTTVQPNTADRLYALGRYMAELASLSPAQFRSEVNELVRRRAFDVVERKETSLRNSPGHPHYWRIELRRQMHMALEAFKNPDHFIPCDVPGPHENSDPASTLQKLIGRLGELLKWWPAIVAETRELAERGVRLAQPLT